MSNCLICLCDFEDGKKYTCCDPRCSEYICFECLKRYIEISGTENTLPTCPREKCEGVFEELTIDKSLLEQYRLLLIKYHKLVKTSDIETHSKNKAIVALLKEEKMKFVVEQMPKAVQKVAQLAFMHRLKKVQKIQTGRNANRVSRTCINLVCNGFLDETFKCTKCNTQFCKECEEEKSDGHVCDANVLESIKTINGMVSCPSCKTKIEKSEGCMAITCAVCKTNFWYNTGEKGDHGNHGMYTGVDLKRTVSLGSQYEQFIPREFSDHIRELEQSIVKTDIEKLQISFEKMILSSEKINERKFSEIYSSIVRKRIGMSISLKKLSTLEKILRNHEDGYEKQISDVLELKKISVGRIFSKKGDITIIDDVTVFDTITECMEKMKISGNEIRRTIEKGDGIYKGFLFAYE